MIKRGIGEYSPTAPVQLENNLQHALLLRSRYHAPFIRVNQTLELNRLYYTESSNLRSVRLRSDPPKMSPLYIQVAFSRVLLPKNNAFLVPEAVYVLQEMLV